MLKKMVINGVEDIYSVDEEDNFNHFYTDVDPVTGDKIKIPVSMREVLYSKKNDFTSFNIWVKNKIKNALVEVDELFYLLNNKELFERGASNAEYFDVNIREALSIPETQTNITNFILMTTSFKSHYQFNGDVRILLIEFKIMCEQKGLNVENLGVKRHDLIAAIIENTLKNSSTVLGGPSLKLVSDEEGVTDTDFLIRDMVFQVSVNDSMVAKYNKETGKTVGDYRPLTNEEIKRTFK